MPLPALICRSCAEIIPLEHETVDPVRPFPAMKTSPSSEFKDAVDGLRYALRRWLTGQHLVSAGPKLVVT